MPVIAPYIEPASVYCRSIGEYMGTSISGAAITDQPNDTWDRVLLSLRDLRCVRTGWDGGGALAPSADILRSAIELVVMIRSQIPAPTTAVATPAGTILFGWYGSSVYRELEVVAPNQAEWMLVDQTNTATHGEFRFTSAGMPNETGAMATYGRFQFR